MSKHRAGYTSSSTAAVRRRAVSELGGRCSRGLGTFIVIGWVAAVGACGPPATVGPGPALVADPAPTKDGRPPGAGTSDLDRGVAYVEREAWAKAIPHLEKAIEAKPTNAEAEYYLALAHDNLKDREKAEKGYARALELDGKLINARLNLAAIYLEEPVRPEKAIEMLGPAVEQEPKAPDVRLNLAYAYRLTEQYDKAAQQYDEALKLKDDAEARYIYADMLFVAGQHKEAAEQMRQVLPAVEKDLEKVTVLAHRLAKCKAYDDCVSAFDMVLKLKNDEPGFYLHRGLCKHSLKQEKEARADYNAAIQANPKFAPAYYYLAMSYVGANKRGKAAKALRKAIRLGKGTRVGDQAKAQLDKLKAEATGR